MQNALVATIIAIIVATVSFYGMLVQAYLNMEHRSAYALSAYSLLLINTIGTFKIAYMFLLVFPRILIFLVLVQVLMSYVLTYQYYVYTQSKQAKRLISRVIMFLVVATFGVMITGFFVPFILIGSALGWLTLFIAFIAKIPQIIHNYKRKTLHGYSLQYLVSNVVISLLAFTSTLLFDLPLHSILLDLRQIVFHGIEVAQYYYYGTD